MICRPTASPNPFLSPAHLSHFTVTESFSPTPDIFPFWSLCPLYTICLTSSLSGGGGCHHSSPLTSCRFCSMSPPQMILSLSLDSPSLLYFSCSFFPLNTSCLSRYFTSLASPFTSYLLTCPLKRQLPETGPLTPFYPQCLEPCLAHRKLSDKKQERVARMTCQRQRCQ